MNLNFWNKLFGDPNQRELDKLMPLVEKINALEPEFEKLTDDQLKQKTNEIKKLISDQSVDSEKVIIPAFALVREAAKRTLSQRHYDVQLIGALVLNQGKIAEMKTGEGKTLSATLSVYLNALEEKGVHVITVNDYLAKRDAVWMGQIYHALGLKVACIVHEAAFLYDPEYVKEFKVAEQSIDEKIDEDEIDESRDKLGGFKVEDAYLRPVTRKQAYLADITYGTNNEYGFDYLRDNLAQDNNQLVQRGLHYAIIDEIDSILIDEARTPLIISAPAEQSADYYYQLARIIKRLKKGEKLKDEMGKLTEESGDYIVDEKARAAYLTQDGQQNLVQQLGSDPWEKGDQNLVHHIEAALDAEALFHLDVHYLVKNKEIVIVDEFTGRLMPGRRWSGGRHQAVEAKEHISGYSEIEIKKESRTLATISFQNYFRFYTKLAGMTGTALTESEEFHKIYKLEVLAIPTNKPNIRQDMPDQIYRTEAGKWKALVNEVKEKYEKGQPILIGTISVEKNEIVSRLLEENGIKHNVLNAKNHEREAAIIAQAGKLKAITVATNMAGRGVDIILGGNPINLEEQKKVLELGGLHVIGTERHESRRIDNQLRGRSARQGDPGSTQFLVSLDDDLMKIFGGNKIAGLMERLRLPEEMPIENRMVSRSLGQAQKKVEGFNFDSRKHLLEYDDVLNKQRETIYRKRNKLIELDHKQLKEEVFKAVEEVIKNIVIMHTAGDSENHWEIEKICNIVKNIFPCPNDLIEQIQDIEKQNGRHLKSAYTRDRIIKYLMSLGKEAFKDLENRVQEAQTKLEEKNNTSKNNEIRNNKQKNIMEMMIRSIFLQTIDRHWVDHLEIIENLKGGIGLRAYAQQDPLVSYKKESFQKFNQLLERIHEQVAFSIYKVGLIQNLQQRQDRELKLSGANKGSQESESLQVQENKKKIGRNDPCPCGSGKKYKKCCGK